jgi:hypothetical protein
LNARAWCTTDSPPPGFESAWESLVARLPYGHFGFRLDVLRWFHHLGTPSLAVMVEESGWSGAIVARREHDTWVSGLPWRWMAAVTAEGRAPEHHLSAEEARTLFRQLERFAGGRRVRAHLTPAPRQGMPSFQSGRTLIHRIGVDDDALLKAMDKTKRAMIKRAQREGYQVVEATRPDQFRAFAAVQRATDRRHGREPLDDDTDEPRFGERWREWELPWMWLLIAEREGQVGSGFGLAHGAGHIIESRAAASTTEALKSGAFMLLAFEAAKRARERGYHYLNWGGDTFFKRDLSRGLASHVPLHCWLGGGARWQLANHGEVLMHAARGRAVDLLHALRSATGRKSA